MSRVDAVYRVICYCCCTDCPTRSCQPGSSQWDLHHLHHLRCTRPRNNLSLQPSCQNAHCPLDPWIARVLPNRICISVLGDNHIVAGRNNESPVSLKLFRSPSQLYEPWMKQVWNPLSLPRCTILQGFHGPDSGSVGIATRFVTL